MLTNMLARRAAIGLLVVAAACGDDKHGKDDGNATGEQGDGGPGVVHSDAGANAGDAGGRGDIDAGRGLDGSSPDGNEGSGDAGTSTSSDGAVTTPGDTLDAAVSDAASADAAASSDDAAVSVDAASGANDAAVVADAAAPADAGSCTINDPRFGCGTEISPTWVRFDNGLEIDRVSGLGWTPVRTLGTNAPDIENQDYCLGLDFVGTGDWDVPEIDAIRTLAAGCSQTVTGGACPVTEMEQQPVTDGSCACAAGTQPPSANGFCRPELTSCDTIWSRTWCGPNGPTCSSYEHWFYLVNDGSVVLLPYEQTPPNVKGRCVSKLLGPLP